MTIKNISEKKLRVLIKEALVNELVNLGGGVRLTRLSYGKCDITIPESFKALLKTGGPDGMGIDTVAEFQKMFPGVTELNDAVISELDTIMKYGNVAANILGVGTLQCTLVGLALEKFGELLAAFNIGGADKFKEEGKKAGALSLSFDSQIRKKANNNGADQSQGFLSSYPFYVFPQLSKLGSESRDTELLIEDTELYFSKMEAVRNINKNNFDVIPPRL